MTDPQDAATISSLQDRLKKAEADRDYYRDRLLGEQTPEKTFRLRIDQLTKQAKTAEESLTRLAESSVLTMDRMLDRLDQMTQRNATLREALEAAKLDHQAKMDESIDAIKLLVATHDDDRKIMQAEIDLLKGRLADRRKRTRSRRK